MFALPKSEDGEKGLVDAPELFGGNVPNEVAQAGGVNSPNLFDQDSGGLAFHVHFGPKGRRPGAMRSRGHQDNGSWQELIGLDDNPVAPALLLVAATSGWPENVNITPEHAGSP